TPWASMDFARDPSKVLYKADGQPNIDHDISANIYMPGFRDWISDQVIRSITELGWDSVFLDCSQVPPWYAGLYDWQGRPAGESLGKDPDSVGTAFYTDFCSRISAKYPQFVFMHNPEVFKAEFQYPKSFVAAGRMAMLEIGGGGGQICNKSSIYGQWDSLLNAFATIRATKRRYNVEQVRSDTLMLQNFGGEITTKTLTAICFANGFNTEIPGMPPGSIYADDLRQYMQFGAARYSALIYHDKIRWISPADVRITVDAPPSVRWKDYVFQRDLGDETDLIIHLFQLPPGKYVFRQPERQPILSNLKMTIPALEGMTFKDVWLLSPDRPARAETMKASVKRGAIQITIPDLWIYDVVVARYTKGGRP
ncbi:MAG: hypothetical protein L6437_00895, partial [Kiritimatiellae bacterium]|nr:hypothetical protein [Kiritimatiellia bacterium]